jgi:hypothetical protein
VRRLIVVAAIAALGALGGSAGAASADDTGVCSPNGTNDRPIVCVNSTRCNDVQETIKPIVYRYVGGDQWGCTS